MPRSRSGRRRRTTAAFPRTGRLCEHDRRRDLGDLVEHCVTGGCDDRGDGRSVADDDRWVCRRQLRRPGHRHHREGRADPTVLGTGHRDLSLARQRRRSCLLGRRHHLAGAADHSRSRRLAQHDDHRTGISRPSPRRHRPTPAGRLRRTAPARSATPDLFPSSDNSGSIASYEIDLAGHLLATASGGATEAAVRGLSQTGSSSFRIAAIDAAGNRSPLSSTVVVAPRHRPSATPHAIPNWAFQLLAWQQAGRAGPRPRAPKRLPAWYWRWQTWRLQPLRVLFSPVSRP